MPARVPTASIDRARETLAEIILVPLCLAILVAAFAICNYNGGYILWYGDAQAHLNISRSIFDSRTPGYSQLGTVWLPLLHLICVPFVRWDVLWTSGLAGTIPVACCFVAAGAFLYSSVRPLYGRAPAIAALACFALNPNILYLATIPMTEIVFMAGLMLLLFCFVRFRITGTRIWIAGGIVATWAMCLTRYDGWFLIPFVALCFCRRRVSRFALILVLASAASIGWIAFNWWQTGNPLDFYNGPYSAAAIQAGKPYPGLHNWPLAGLYFGAAAALCAGWPLVAIGVIGFFIAVRKSAAPVLLLGLTPLFYIWSVHSSQTPIFVPWLEPHGYYNTRYGIIIVPLAAFCAAALARKVPKIALALPIVAILPWLAQPEPKSWITWNESRVNSTARRAWTNDAAAYLNANYSSGSGILTEFGDLTGIFCRGRIPLSETLHEGNGPAWWGGAERSDLYHPSAFAIAQQDDRLSRWLHSAHSGYALVDVIAAPSSKPIEIYRRNP